MGWGAGPKWLWTVGILQDWIRFPGRFADLDSTMAEDQRQFNLSVAALRRFGEEGFLAGWLIYRWTNSNVKYSEYEGPVLSLRARAALPYEIALSGYIAASHRGYLRFLSADSLGLRQDDTWQFGVRAHRRVHSRVSVFLDGSYLHQGSNLEAFSYNQSRVAVGLILELLAAPARAIPGLRPGVPDFAPVRKSKGVLFRLHAPDAESVSVVGGWNAWEAGAHPLEGPDKKGVWEALIPLRPGIWRYAFVVDGEWITPPGAIRYEDDGFGGRNGVLVVSEPKTPAVTKGGETRRKQ